MQVLLQLKTRTSLELDVLQLHLRREPCINIGRSVGTTMDNETTDVTKQATKTKVPEKLLGRLLSFEPTAAPVISLYLDARADQHGQQNFLPFVRKQLSERSKSFETSSEEQKSFEEDFVRIIRYLEGEVPPSV